MPPWAPASLRKADLPRAYLELRHPNGSVVHVVGTRELSPSSVGEVKRLVRAAKADSVLLELCDERLAPVWELLERGKSSADGAIVRLLPELQLSSFRDDARLRRLGWWAHGLRLEGYASLAGTTLGADQAVAAAEAARFRAQTHLIDRRQSVTVQRQAIAGLESLTRQILFGSFDAAADTSRGPPPELRAAFNRATASLDNDAENLQQLRTEAQRAIEASAPFETGELIQSMMTSPTWLAATNAVVAEREEIMAHRCWECLGALGPGGVAVAVVGEKRLDGISKYWGTTDAEVVKAKLRPRDAPAVLYASAPLLVSTTAAGCAVAYMPRLPRRLALTSLFIAPCVGAALAINQYSHLYDTVRKLQLRLDSHM